MYEDILDPVSDHLGRLLENLSLLTTPSKKQRKVYEFLHYVVPQIEWNMMGKQ